MNCKNAVVNLIGGILTTLVNLNFAKTDGTPIKMMAKFRRRNYLMFQGGTNTSAMISEPTEDKCDTR
jgi:hypothetical protein